MVTALAWGVVAASSLVLGMLLGLARSWPSRLIGLVLAFASGALVSAVSFELFEEASTSAGHLGRDRARSLAGPASPNPELIQQHVPERVVLVVADARAERRHRARVVEQHPRCGVDELVIDPAP
jgi:hypothetical protein